MLDPFRPLHVRRNVQDPIPVRAGRRHIEEFARRFAEGVGLRVGQPIAPVFARLKGTYGRHCSEFGGHDRLVVTPGPEMFVEDRWSTFEFDEPHMNGVLAEAIGHFVLHYPLVRSRHGEGASMAVPRIAGEDPDLRQASGEAIWFGAGLLMPADAFVEAAAPGLDDAALARRFNVSQRAARSRRRSLSGRLYAEAVAIEPDGALEP